MSDFDLFSMINLYPRTTGLPVTVWVGHAQGDARLVITPEQYYDPDHAVVWAFRPFTQISKNSLDETTQRAVCAWLALNYDALVEYWEERIDGAELCTHLEPLIASPLPTS